MKLRVTVIVYLIAAIAVNGFSQTKSEILTNKLVIEMFKAGLSKETVISKIQSSGSKYDLSTTGLIALKKQGVPDEIINAMMAKESGTVSATTTSTTVTGPASTGTGRKVNIDLLNHIYTYNNESPKPLEKVTGSSKSTQRMLGYGGNELTVQIEGTSSPIKLSADAAESFIINMGGNTLPDYVLYKVKIAKGKRYALVGKLTLTGPQSGDNTISLGINKVGEGLYQIKPAQKLEKGEYFFTAKPNLNTSTSNTDVYAFSVI